MVTGATLASTDYRRPGKGAQYLQRLGFQQHRNLFWSWYEPRNFGDWIGPYLYEKITGMVPRYLKPRKSVKACFFASAGSILRHIQVDDQAVVWGSGIISQDDTFGRPREVAAVRGPRSQERLHELGFKVPDVVGDPGILLPHFYQAASRPVPGRIGLIPHFFDLAGVRALASPDMHVVDVTRPVEQVVDDLTTCEFTLSTSLHGLIVSHAYGIPSVWCRSLKALDGDGTKFSDYLESVGLGKTEALLVDFSLSADRLRTFVEFATLPRLSNLQERLLEVCPFPRRDLQ